ncbi:MAG: glutathione S-transferase family protein [Phyllobacteriaceae bacterium]|nr:glutathione S-transferase family protein [Phyllobacteriaceae bacterium]
MAILYYSRNPNPRLALAVARHLKADVALEWAAPFDPAQSTKFRPLNPSLRIPILLENGHSLWEADAIACRLSMMMHSQFWRTGEDTPEMIRWISWGKGNFVWACDMVSFEFGTKQRYGLGPVDHTKVEEGEALFHESAAQLDAHLKGRDWLLDSGLSYADFRMATFLPFNDVAGLPIADYSNIASWQQRLQLLPAWAYPFDGLSAPDLPFAPPRQA